MNLSDTPFAEKKFMTVNGQRMAYIDEAKAMPLSFRTVIRPRPISGATSCRPAEGSVG